MTDFLLELRSEEIPARMQAKAKEDLARLFNDELAKAGLAAANVETFATPRRLALIATGLPLETEAVSEETKGPKVGAPPQAMEGFLRKLGLTQDQLTERDGVYFAIVEKPGRKTADVLAEAIPAIVRAFPWPKSQRWGNASISTESLRWVRPLQGIIALLGDDVVPCEVGGIVSGATTMGHRFHHSGPITIGNAGDYVEKLRACHVLVHFSERCRIIRDGAEAAAKAVGLTLVEDEGLVAENAGLTEWPVPMLGRFDPAFLAVPEEVIQLTARINQKYFICRDADGKLANAFVCTANIEANDGGAEIVAGNQKVLAARLSDAKFFWEQDLKIPLETQAEKLSSIVFHEKLGTVADKVERVAKLARWLVEEKVVGSNPTPATNTTALADEAERAARLAKADLVTGMVGEFPELQGVIGGYYARAQGESDAVADAVRDHYKPVGQGDDVPTAPVTVAVSLADKLDTLIHFFAAGLLPTGSKDPFALRRAVLGASAIVLENGIRLPLSKFINETYVESLRTWTEEQQILLALSDEIETETFGPDGKSITKMQRIKSRPESFGDWDWLTGRSVTDVPLRHIGLHWQQSDKMEASPFLTRFEVERGVAFLTRPTDVVEQLLEFFADRLKVQQREAGVRHDLIDAVFAVGGEDDLVRLLTRVKALQSFVSTEDGTNLLAGYKRAANILKAAEGVDPAAPTPADLVAEEAALKSAIDAAETKATAAVEAEDFEGAMAALASLRAPIDAFFDGVMVNDPDPAKRAFRLGLLARFRDAVHKVADFSKIEG